MKNKMTMLMALTIAIATNVYASGSKKAEPESKAEQTLDKAVEGTKELGNDTARAVKKAGREIEDKACEMVNGKLDCATKKIEHAAENAADKAKDLAD